MEGVEAIGYPDAKATAAKSGVFGFESFDFGPKNVPGRTHDPEIRFIKLGLEFCVWALEIKKRDGHWFSPGEIRCSRDSNLFRCRVPKRAPGKLSKRRSCPFRASTWEAGEDRSRSGSGESVLSLYHHKRRHRNCRTWR